MRYSLPRRPRRAASAGCLSGGPIGIAKNSIPACPTKGESKQRASGLVGFALDGYPIYGPRGRGGKLLTDDDLDACHGQVSRVWFEGRWQRIYHYSATLEYPYTVGCFRGSVS